MGRLTIEHRAARNAAIEAGQKHYQGKACKHCEGTARYVSNGACVSCSKSRALAGYHSNPEQRERMRAQASAWAKDNRLEFMLNLARNRAKRAGAEFSITLDDLGEIPETCPILGIPMLRPSLDRVDNSKGYVKGNVAIISERANRLKRDFLPDEILALAAYVQRNLALVSENSATSPLGV